MPSIETNVYITLDSKEYECNVTAMAGVLTGGSNRHGSDEPEWAEVLNLTLYNQRGDKVSKRFMDQLDETQINHLHEELIENNH